MVRCRLTSASLVTVLVLAGCASASAGGPRALLELFSSQGCSSCPAADTLVGRENAVAVPSSPARERASARVRGDRQVSAPQIVVNGATQVVGGAHSAI